VPVIVGRRAVIQIETASRWWAANRAAAPGAVAEDLEKASALIAAQPECGTPVKSARVAGVRRVHLPRVGYYQYYRVARRARRRGPRLLAHKAWRRAADRMMGAANLDGVQARGLADAASAVSNIFIAPSA
jgi:plasmid stabilization system protein ParE